MATEHRTDTEHESRGWVPWVIGLVVVALIAIVLFFALGGDADGDIDPGGVDIDVESPDAEFDVDAPDIDVETPDIDIDPGDVDIEDGDAEADVE